MNDIQQISFNVTVEDLSFGSEPITLPLKITFEEENGQISSRAIENDLNQSVIPKCLKKDVLPALKKHFEKVMDDRHKDAVGRGHQSCDIKFSDLKLLTDSTFFDEKTIRSTFGIND